MTSFLDRLVADARRRSDEAQRELPLDQLRAEAEQAPAAPSFLAALQSPGVAVIAEVKRASPSRGDLAPTIDAKAQASHYAAAGVAAISVLTEPELFKGCLDDLRAVATLGPPTIRKDFIVDPYQVFEARAAGAAAILLIVTALDDADLRALHDTAVYAGLDVLVEVHDEEELARANDLGAAITGVNARDLHTFEVDRDAFARLRGDIAPGIVAVAESGIQDVDDVRAAAAQGADAVLVGEALVVAQDPEAAAAALVAAGAELVTGAKETP